MENLEKVDESFQCSTGFIIMSALDTLSIFGIFNDASVKYDLMVLISKIETLLTNREKQANIIHFFTLLLTKRKVIKYLEISYTILLCDF